MELKMKTMKSTFTVIFLFLLNSFLLPQSVKTEGDINRNLVSVDWLEKNLKSSDVLVIDAQPAQQYDAQHIPGAVNMDFMSYGKKEFPVDPMSARNPVKSPGRCFRYLKYMKKKR